MDELPNPPIDGPALKIERAKQHITDLNTKVSAYYAHGERLLLAKDDRKTNRRIIYVKKDQPLIGLFSPVMGDAIHNMRAALDLIFWELFSDYVTDPRKRMFLRFPFRDSLKDLKGLLKDTEIDGRAPKQVVAALYDIKPYKGGNSDLRGLHELDIADKHQVLIPVASHIVFSDFNIGNIDPTSGLGANIFDLQTGGLELGSGFAEWPKSANSPTLARVQRRLDKHTKGKFSGTISFRGGLPFAGEPIIPTLRRLLFEVEDVIAKLRLASEVALNESEAS